ncbi:unnamed protein product, partial [Rotaria sordida]
IKNHSSIVVAVQTRAAKLRNQTSNDATGTPKFTSDSLISPSPNNSLNTSIEKNRIILFSIEELIQAQQNDNYAKNILNNIKKYKTYMIKDNLLMRRLNPLSNGQVERYNSTMDAKIAALSHI